MKLYSEGQNYKLYNGNMLELLDVIEPNSVDSIVTDPPYELNFMNKGWDNSGIAFQKETWRKCLKVLKPGGYLLTFGGSRTYHRIACAIEDAGFEIRDTIMWLYGSGFPKSMNIGLAIDKKYGVEGELAGVKPEEAKKWDGWGTQLKPAYESITVARKPCEGSCVDNVMKYGVGGINIDECRVPHSEPVETMHRHTDKGNNTTLHTYGDSETDCIASPNEQGRFPANVILTYDETDFEEICGGMPYTKSTGGSGEASVVNNFKNTYNGGWKPDKDAAHLGGLGDEGSAARYFYCAKASKRDRDEGLEAFEVQKTGDLQGGRKEGSAGSIMQNADGGTRVNPYAGTGAPKKNTHPTVKPCELMQYLVRLVTPKGGIVLDPFNGSGSTGKAVMYENKERDANYKYIGIELTEEYLPIADARINYVNNLKVQGSLL